MIFAELEGDPLQLWYETAQSVAEWSAQEAGRQKQMRIGHFFLAKINEVGFSSLSVTCVPPGRADDSKT